MKWRSDGPRTVPQAFPYQGSKRVLTRQILSLIPPNLQGTLIEPFAGSAAVSVAARYYQLVGPVTISDVNGPLMDLWRMIIDKPEQLASEYETMWQEQLDDPRAYFLAVRDKFNATHEPSALLYLLARCVKAAVRYGKNGDFNQSADHRRLGTKPDAMRSRIMMASSLMQGVTVLSESYEALLTEARPDDLVYMDPPYQGTSFVPDHRYMQGLRREHFIDVLAESISHGVSFILSYDKVTDDKKYGEVLPEELGMVHRHVVAGASSQATLLGRQELSTESIYISPALVERLGGPVKIDELIDVVLRHQEALF